MAKKRKQKFFESNPHSGAFLPPGTVSRKDSSNLEAVTITVLEYDELGFVESKFSKPEDCTLYINNDKKTWINIDGVHNTELIEKFGSMFKLHPLTLEDIASTSQRPKFEEYDDYNLVIMKMLYADENRTLQAEQLSIILMKNQVITFQEKQGGDAFDFIRKRIKEGKGRIRRHGNDYLCYALIDAVVDSYFNLLEKTSDKIEELDEELMSNPSGSTILKLHHMKRELLFLRKAVWPVRDLLNMLQRSETVLISDSTDIFIRDVYDHIIRVIEGVENYRDLVGGMMDIYLSSISNRMNEVMKVLTIISTIFIPVTFIAGVYGMNFEFMPELHSRYGYISTWVVMLLMMLLLVYYFRRKKWL